MRSENGNKRMEIRKPFTLIKERGVVYMYACVCGYHTLDH